MSALAAPREPWAVGIEEELELVAQARRNADDSSNLPTMFRVLSCIKALKPEEYEHEVLSFGLYGRDFEKMTRMDEVRLQVVSEFLEQVKAMPHLSIHSWEDLCECVTGPVQKAHELRQLYDDGPAESVVSSTTVRSVLTFDAVFLMVFIINLSEDSNEVQLPNFERLLSIFSQKAIVPYVQMVVDDLWLCENQIPLFLIRKVWNLVWVDASDHHFNTHISGIVRQAVKSYLHTRDQLMSVGHYHRISFTECDHLLHCLYIAVCHHNRPASEPQAWRQNTTSDSTDDSCLISVTDALMISDNDLSLLTATELHKAGIILRGEQRSISDIRLVKSAFFKATLYLPEIMLDDTTERILRNLSSFETFQSDGDHQLISYLRIMDDLINTEEDVRLLRKGKHPVIRANYLGDDKDIADLFNALGEKVLTVQSKESKKLVKDVNNWCKLKKRQMFIRFVDRFLDRPWIVISLAAATLLLVLTALQTAYTVKA